MSATLASTVLAGSTLAENSLGPLVVGLAAGSGANRTQPSTTPFSLYALALRAPTPPYVLLFYYIFPLSPQMITREVGALGNYYDVAGSPSNFGVNRIVDVYGQSPPIYNIRGTTGVKFHSRDGYQWSGLESAQILEGMIAQYFSFNSAQAQAGAANLYRLEFYDFYQYEFWEVVPLGPQGISQSSARPQLIYYNFRFVATTSLEQPIAQLLDPILQNLEQPIAQAYNSMSSDVTSFLGSYSPNIVS